MRCSINVEAKVMTTFDKREEAFEQQFARDEALKFKATARRNKLLGLWAAEKLGLTGTEADSYALAVVMSDFEEAGDHDVARNIDQPGPVIGSSRGDTSVRSPGR